MIGYLTLNAQEYKFGKVDDETVLNYTYAQDTTASAVVLLEDRETYFNYEHPEGWVVVTDIHQRIKVLNTDGLDYATTSFVLYKSGGDRERIRTMKGYSFSPDNGKVVKEKLRNNGIFENKLNDNYTETTVTFPNVKVGSVVDLEYSIVSPFWEIEDLVIQQDIPVAHYRASVRTPGYFKYKRIVRGNVNISPNEYTRRRNMNIAYESGTKSNLTQATKTSNIQIEESVSEYDFKHIPALKEEPFVDNIDNYRFLVTYELAQVENADGTKKSYATSWEEVVKSIYDSKYFGDQLARKGYLKELVAQIKSEHTGALDRAAAAFDAIQKHMTWNGDYSKFSRNISQAYKEKTGSSGDINLMLVALMRELGLSASPVLVSTRSHGIPVFATVDGFNYVIAAVNINDQRFLMDATEKWSIPNVLPPRILNWYGTIVRESGTSSQISLYPEQISKRNYILNVELLEDGTIEGAQRGNSTLLDALSYRIEYSSTPKEQLEEDILDRFGLTEIEELEVKDLKDRTKPVTSSFHFVKEDAVEFIGNDIYLTPMFWLAMDSNPFTRDTRNFPVDYNYPFSHRKIVNIKIPEGYQVSSMPESVSISLPDGMGSFKYRISESSGTIGIQCSFEINQSVIPAFKYADLKEFYNQRLSKEMEQVVLSPI
ncbi:hypothetical protein BST85_01135 [Aureitalea marina]|uniref:DUF3857 domain-containing protein n=1 Tax=Aureitalea marina TaxID=930804 RepID=A0A2S7KM27_9FLAO|nr:hypothetical protein BST85_01135 [Aureitalea marina]